MDPNDHDDATPRWVKVFAVAALLALVLLVLLFVFGGTDHGPGRHALTQALAR